MTTQGPVLCMACTRLHPGPDIATCDAFPDGIPEEILNGGDHHEPRGDEVDGLVFDPADTPGAEVALDAWEALNGGQVGDASRALGHDVTPGHDELHHYWTRGEGLAKWAESPKPWTTLVAHLTKYVGPLKAKVYASRWFHEVFGFYAGSDLNRVTHGKPPRGHRVGPG